MPKIRILFVDDEVSLLQGLEDRLHRYRKVWEMVFANGAEAALAQLEASHFDVVVSDIRMPGMDGAELLARIKAKYPSIARIVLSGHAEPEAVMRTLPVAHQFLSKPCDGEVLRVVVDRVCKLQSLLHDPSLRAMVGTLERLPSVPRIYVELGEVLASPDKGAKEVAEVIEKDAAMTAKVLQLVNSSYFGLQQRTTSVVRGVAYLGAERVRALALSAHVFGLLEGAPVPGFSAESTQDRALAVARLARSLATKEKANEAFTAGLVHEVGTMVLAATCPAILEAILRKTADSGRWGPEVEQEEIHVTHAEVGAYLLGMWGVPFSIVEAVALQFRPGELVEGDSEVLASLHFARASVEAGPVRPGKERTLRVDAAFLQRAVGPARLASWETTAATAPG